jgi:hypothetical protein
MSWGRTSTLRALADWTTARVTGCPGGQCRPVTWMAESIGPPVGVSEIAGGGAGATAEGVTVVAMITSGAVAIDRPSRVKAMTRTVTPGGRCTRASVALKRPCPLVVTLPRAVSGLTGAVTAALFSTTVRYTVSPGGQLRPSTVTSAPAGASAGSSRIVGAGISVAVGVAVAVAVRVGVCVGIGVGLAVVDGVCVGSGVKLAVADGVCVGSGVKLAVADGVCVGSGVKLAVVDGVCVGSGVKLAVADGV